MKKHLFLILLLGFLSGQAHTQVILNPAFEMSTSPDVKILEIERTRQYTIMRLSFETTMDYIDGGWIAVMEQIYLRDVKTGKKFLFKKAENVPSFPTKHLFTGPGQRLKFTLYFEPVDASTKYIDIIENVQNGFNYFRVALIDIA